MSGSRTSPAKRSPEASWIESLIDLTLLVLEAMVCDGVIGISREKNGRGTILVSRIFKYVWSRFADVYLDLCTKEGFDDATCRDSGPFILRAALFKLMKYSRHPVAELLRQASLRRITQKDLERTCVDVVRLYGFDGFLSSEEG